MKKLTSNKGGYIMPWYIIRWDAGNGEEFDIVEAKDSNDACDMAYESWREDAESNSDYNTVGEATEELKEEHGL